MRINSLYIYIYTHTYNEVNISTEVRFLYWNAVHNKSHETYNMYIYNKRSTNDSKYYETKYTILHNRFLDIRSNEV